jgi:hypothetical protein
MSTDFSIDTAQLLELGATLSLELNDTNNKFLPERYELLTTYLQLPNYPYKRDVALSPDSKRVMLSCSGAFRSYLTDYLKSNNITYEEY